MKRRGFTLIELMVVIAIIIILAAIAIPNYLSMTARAKRSRVASDFAAIATALETYKTDWNTYPAATADNITLSTGVAFKELAGTGGTVNVSNVTTAMGETGPIVYMTGTILQSMTNPYFSGTTAATATNQYLYTGILAAPGIPSTWKLTAATGGTPTYLKRTSDIPTLADASTP